MTTEPTRRERLRSATSAEIKGLARRLLVFGGPPAISLRAIAREMGMTAGAIYRYFPSLDALVLDLAEDLYGELTGTVEAARTTVAPDDPIAQLVEMARAFRRWCVEHPSEFGLMFGNPVPGIAEFEDGCLHPDHAGARFGAPFLDALVGVWRQAPFATPPIEVIRTRLEPYLGPDTALKRADGVPIEIIYVFVSSWTRLYGLVAMEVFGHLRWAVTNVESVFELELAAFVEQLQERPT